MVTNQLVFKIDELVSWCSKFFTLLPGDVILTGTPPGVGVFMKPPKFLKVSTYYVLPLSLKSKRLSSNVRDDKYLRIV